jgi:hypothetical protein
VLQKKMFELFLLLINSSKLYEGFNKFSPLLHELSNLYLEQCALKKMFELFLLSFTDFYFLQVMDISLKAQDTPRYTGSIQKKTAS